MEITEDYLRTETQLPAILVRKTVGSLDEIDVAEGGAWGWLGPGSEPRGAQAVE